MRLPLPAAIVATGLLVGVGIPASVDVTAALTQRNAWHQQYAPRSHALSVEEDNPRFNCWVDGNAACGTGGSPTTLHLGRWPHRHACLTYRGWRELAMCSDGSVWAKRNGRNWS